MKIAITGAAGALGEAVRVVALERGHHVFSYRHGEVDIAVESEVRRAIRHDEPDVVINCAGEIDRNASRSRLLWANAYGAAIVGGVCIAEGVRIIHVSTDCVFNGERPMFASKYNGPHGPYPARAEPDAHFRDLYGATKSLGEMQPDSSFVTVVRTSFVTPRHGLVRWLRGELKAGRPVDGYIAVWWSGSSAWHVGSALVDIAEHQPRQRVVHLATAEPITKFEALQRIAEVYGLDASLIRPVWDPVLNRALVPDIKLPALDGSLRWPA